MPCTTIWLCFIQEDKLIGALLTAHQGNYLVKMGKQFQL